MSFHRSWLVMSLFVAAGPLGAQTTASLPEDFFSEADYRFVGPVGNRVSAVIGEPGNANVYYFGAASGGIFKSEDAGHSWTPIFDGQPAQSIGALALAPSDPECALGGDGGGLHPIERLDRKRGVPLNGRRRNLASHGARGERPHRTDPDRPPGPELCLRRGARALVRSAAGARRVPDARRRRDVGAGALRRREQRRGRPGHEPGKPPDPVRCHMADADLDLGSGERGARQRTLEVHRLAETRGSSSRARVYRRAGWGRSAWPSRPTTPAACMR